MSVLKNLLFLDTSKSKRFYGTRLTQCVYMQHFADKTPQFSFYVDHLPNLIQPI